MIKLWKRKISIVMAMIMMLSQIGSKGLLATESENLIAYNKLIDEVLLTTTSGGIEIKEEQVINVNGEISSVEELKALANAKPGEVYRLTQDIDLSNQNWASIDFNATLDGKGYTITLNGEPLFKTIGEQATVKNLILEGSVSGNQDTGALAFVSEGSVYNNYSSANVKSTDIWASSGGLVGEIKAGHISNCFVTGKVGGFTPGGGITGSYTGGKISDSYWVGSMSSAAEFGYNGENCSRKSEEEAKKQAFSDLLNKNLTSEDIKWGFDLNKSAYPILGATGQAPIDKTLLTQKLEEAKRYDNQSNTYTEKTWQALQKAIQEAQSVADDNTVTQDKVDEAIKMLNKAIKGLLKVVIDPLPPANENEIIPLSTKDELKTMEDGKYYKLQNDIVLDEYWYNNETLNAILDGNGFKIIMNNGAESVFGTIGENGVVKNLGITGNMNGYSAGSALAKINQGRIINSYVTASIKTSGKKVIGGLVETLDGGAIHNTYVSGTLEATSSGTKGGLVGKFKSGSITNSYWLEGVTASQAIGHIEEGAPEPDLDTVSKKDDMKSEALITLLNANKGNSMAWGYDKKENAIVIGGKDQLPGEGEVSPYTITYTAVDGVTTTRTENGKMKLFTTERGNFKLEGYDEEIYWVDDPEPYHAKQMLWIRGDGSIHSIDGEGRTKVSAYTKDHRLLAECIVTTITPEALELRIWLDGNNVTNSSAVVKGSEEKALKIEAKLKGIDQFVDVSHGFVSIVTNSDSISIFQNSFRFNRPTTGKITVTAPNGLSVFVEVTSEYVPITSIKPTFEGNYKLHGRNPNSEGGGHFLPILRGVIVEPSNASYKNNYKITSSNPEVAEYIGSMVVGVVPYKTGTATFTAIAQDNGSVKTGSSTMHFEYQEPLQSITTDETNISIGVNQEQVLDLTFTSIKGSTAKNDETSVTEPGLVWTYEGDGKVNIYRKNLNHWVEGGGLAVASQDYTLTGVKEGNVKAIGTPIDQTNGAKPIILNITVTDGEEAEDIHELMKKGINSAKNYLQFSQGDKKYTYSDEWPLFALVRSGGRVSQDKIDAYEDSIVEVYSNKLSAMEKKPTTIARVALTLDAVNKSATNAQGINLIEMLYNHQNLNGTSNDLIFALIALDACQYEVPKDARWTRERILEGILAYQNPSGGFGLTDNQTASVDMTAMALQALSNYTQHPEIHAAVERGLDYLRSKMDTITAGFDGNIEAVAQVLTALTALGIDPTDKANGFVTEYDKNTITNIMMFYDEVNDGFSHILSSKAEEMSTVQALYALEAYRRFINNENKLYDLTDVNIRSVLKKEIDYAEEFLPDDYTEESFEALQTCIKQARELLNNPLASDEMIQAQITQLRKAIERLKWQIPEKKELINQLEQIKRLVATDYTTESWNALQEAARLAESLLEDKLATREDFKKYLEILKEAINNLKKQNDSGIIKERVTLSISAKTIGKGSFIDGKVVEIKQGDTVADVLKAAIGETNLKIRGSGTSLYVSSMYLNGEWLGEFDHGPKSGWMYSVNGQFPDYSSGQYELTGGEQIEWHYTIDLGNDLKDEAKPAEPLDKEELLPIEMEGDKNEAGVAQVKLSDEVLQRFIEEIELLKDNEDASVQIGMMIPEDSKGMVLTLPKLAVSALAQAKDMKLVINSDYASITLDAKTIKHVMAQSKDKEVTIELVEVPTNEQSLEMKMAAEGRATYRFNILSGKDSVMDFGGKVMVDMPYELQVGEKESNILFYYSNEDGSLSVANHIQYNDEDQIIVFQTNTPKSYIISYAKTLFEDVEGWSQPYIYSLVNKDIIQGKEENLFEPKSRITRAEFVMLLARVSQEDLSKYDTLVFEDVKENAWYKQAITWANEKGIAKGYDGKFNPNHDVTRQDIAVMLERYMEHIEQKELPNVQDAVNFTDEDQIAPYAKDAVYKMQQADIIEGNENKAFLPKAKATREEVAKILAVMLQRINE